MESLVAVVGCLDRGVKSRSRSWDDTRHCGSKRWLPLAKDCQRVDSALVCLPDPASKALCLFVLAASVHPGTCISAEGSGRERGEGFRSEARFELCVWVGVCVCARARACVCSGSFVVLH